MFTLFVVFKNGHAMACGQEFHSLDNAKGNADYHQQWAGSTEVHFEVCSRGHTLYSTLIVVPA